MKLLTKIVRRSPADLLLAAEALALLAFFRLCLAMLPVRKTIRMITRGHAGAGVNGDEGATDAAESGATGRELATVRRVCWAVEAVTRNAGVGFVCFPQTLAGYTMLCRRRIPSTMVYGVARSPGGELIAHTWLSVDDRIVLGGEGAEGFTPVERWR